MAEELNVLISGCSVAAASFTWWLLRGHPNAKVTIVERAPSLRLGGAAVDIRSSAVDIIRWMGLEEQIRANTTKEEGMQVVDKNGKPVATMRTTGSTDYQALSSEFEVFRGKLAEIFLTPSLGKVQVLYDETIESYEQRDEKVYATFTKSKDVRAYDLLVAADGLGSRIRGKMLNAPPREHIYDLGVHVAYFNINKNLLHGEKLAKGLNAPGGKAIYLRPHTDPGKTSALLMNVCAQGDDQGKAEMETALEHGNESFMQLMEERFRDVGWLAPEVLAGMWEVQSEFYCSVVAQTRCDRIQGGRVCLLGDAAYATPGFGTSIAIIGGYVLAGELLNNPGNITTALQRYEELILPFAKSQQGESKWVMQYLNPQTQWGVDVRNTLMWFVTWTRLDQLGMFIGSKLGFSEKKLTMPEYPWPNFAAA